MAVRYFRFTNWDKWYPRKEYKSMPWVKMGARYFEDPKLESLSFIEKASVMWVLCQAAQQNLGDGRVRVDESVMRSCCGHRWVREASVTLTKAVGIDVLIEETVISKHGSSDLRIRGKNNKIQEGDFEFLEKVGKAQSPESVPAEEPDLIAANLRLLDLRKRVSGMGSA